MEIHMNGLYKDSSYLYADYDENDKIFLGVYYHKKDIFYQGTSDELSILDLKNGYSVIFVNSVVKTAILVDSEFGYGKHPCFQTFDAPLAEYHSPKNITAKNGILKGRKIEDIEDDFYQDLIENILDMIEIGGANDSSSNMIQLTKLYFESLLK